MLPKQDSEMEVYGYESTVKEEYFEVLHKRYKGASRKEKTIIIDECCAICGYHRKHAIRRLKGYKRFTKPKPKKRGKPVIYNKMSLLSLSSKYG